jgi:hypothetical protein
MDTTLTVAMTAFLAGVLMIGTATFSTWWLLP